MFEVNLDSSSLNQCEDPSKDSMAETPYPSLSALTGQRTETSTSPTLRSNILVVDDTPANLRLLTEILTKQGYDVRPAINGRLALAAAQTMPPDLILLDIMMPEMDGYEVCQRLKANELTQDIPVIFISALDNPKDKVKAFQVGGVDYIPKPFQKEEVLIRVENQLRLQQAQEAVRESEERFRAIFEKAAIGICLTGVDGKILDTNPAFQDFLGYPNEKLTQQELIDLSPDLHPDSFKIRQNESQLFQNLCAGRGDAYQLEKRYIRSDGQVVWGRLTTCAVKKADQVQFAFSFVENITDRKQAEEALKASEEEMRAIFTAMTDLVIIRDRQGRCLKVAPTKAAQFEASPDNLVGKTLYETLPPATAELMLNAIENTLEKQEPTDVEYQVIADNNPTWLDGRLSPLSDDSVVIVARDISQRKIMEQKLRTNEAEIRGIFEAMTDIVLVIDTQDQNVQVMPTNYSQLYDYSSQVIEETFGQFFGQNVNPAFWQPIQEAVSQQKTTNFEYNLTVNDQQLSFVASISPLPNQKAIWVARNISDRVKAEQELQNLAAELERRVIERTELLRAANQHLRTEISDRIQAERELAKSEARFRLAVDNIPDIFSIYDPQGCYQFANVQALTVFQKSLSEMAGKTDLELFPSSMTDQYVPLLQQAVNTGHPQTKECRFTFLDGEEHTLIMTYVPLFDNHEEIYQILGIAYDITERKQSEEAVKMAKERLEAVLDAVPGFVSWIEWANANQPNTTPELRYLGVNRQLASAFSLLPETFVNQSLGFMSLGDEFTKMMEQFFQSSAPMMSKVVDVFIYNRVRSYLIVAQKYQQERASVSVGIDITARVQAEQKLKQAYQRSQLLSELTVKIRQSLDLDEILQTAVVEVQIMLNADRVAIVECNSEESGLVVKEAVNDPFPSLQGEMMVLPCSTSNQSFQHGRCIAQSNLLSKTRQRSDHPSQSNVQAQLIVPIFIQKHIWGALVIHQCHNSREWQNDEIELVTSLTDQIGIALSQAQLLDHLEDMVEERTAELQQEIAERIKAEDALRESEEQLRRVIHNNAYGIVVCNHTGVICFLNEAATHIFGRSQRQLLGRHLGIPIVPDEKSELSILRPDGSQCVVDLRSVSINWEGDTHAHLISLVDITERKAVEQMKDEFLSVASHELRTPLTSIRGSLGLLGTGRLGELNEKGQQMLAIAVNNTDRLTRLLNDILDLERIESGKVKMVQQQCNGIELIIQALQAMQSMAEQSQVTLCLTCHNTTKPLAEVELYQYEPIPVWADPDQILQTLTNLISNAIKFSDPEQTIWVGITPQSEQVLFQVQDQGRGIPPEQKEKIFGRFQQVDASDSREKGGTGLGLPICREIIRQHQGKIWVESAFGEGSTFYFTLPRPSQHQ